MEEQYTICAGKINITALIRAHKALQESLIQAKTQFEASVAYIISKIINT